MSLPRPAIQILRAEGYRRVPWRNGAGWTREIAREPDNADFHWRLSIAEITEDSTFSTFPGIERHLVLLTGNGMRVRFGDGATNALLPPHAGLCFSGDDALECELIDGPTTDFNLMWRRGYVDAQLWHRPLVGSVAIFVDPHQIWALHVLAGRVQLQDEVARDIRQGDTLVLRAGDQRCRSGIEGAGEALLIRISPVASADVTMKVEARS